MTHATIRILTLLFLTQACGGVVEPDPTAEPAPECVQVPEFRQVCGAIGLPDARVCDRAPVGCRKTRVYWADQDAYCCMPETGGLSCGQELDRCFQACPENQDPTYNQRSSCEAACRGVAQACERQQVR